MEKVVKAKDIADYLGKAYENESLAIQGYSTLDDIYDHTILFLNKFSEKLLEKVNQFSNLFLIVCPDYDGRLKSSYVVSENPRLDFIRVLEHFFYDPPKYEGIHPTAVVEEGALIEPGVSIGANCFIGKEVEIKSGTRIQHNVVILGKVKIGSGCFIKSGAVIGEEGFGFETDENGVPHHFPHMGSVEIGNDVFIGSNSTVERATLGVTRICDSVKIDDLVQVGHNTTTGRNTMITVGALICGSASIGENCYLAPNVTIRNKIKVQNDAFIGMGAVVVKDVESGTTVIGNPAKPLKK